MSVAASTNYAAFVLFLLVVDVVLIYRLSRTPGFGREESWIVKLLVASCICALSDALCVGVGSLAGFWGNYLFNFAFDLSTNYIAYLFFFYCALRFNSPVVEKKLWVYLISIPIIVLGIMLVCSLQTGWIFSILPDGTYVRGSLFAIFVFLLANGYTVAAIVVCVVGYVRRNNTETRIALPQCIKYAVPLLLGTYAQFFFTDLPMSNMGLTFTLLLIFMDNQERLLYKKIDEAQSANIAKSEFLSRISHDVRTPINGIVGMIAIARTKMDDPVRVEECLDKVDAASEQLMMLVKDVLDMSKIESGNLELTREVFDLRAMLDSINHLHGLIAQEKGINLVIGKEPALLHRWVVSSPVHVRSVLVNIASNAIKYTEPGGTVTCSVKELAMVKGRLMYEFKVQDTGIGMSEEFSKRVFDPFTQEHATSRTSYQGTGLGLAIVKRIVDMMGGTIDLETQLGEGSTFTIVLPFDAAPKELIPAKESKSADITTLEGLHILLVDDNELNLDIAQFILEQAGATVEIAHNGQEALEVFSGALQGTFDAIVMDVLMPLMDGLETTRRIRALEREDAATVPIVGMSANAFSDDVAAAKQAGMSDYVVKPVSCEKLLAALSSDPDVGDDER